MPCLIRRTLATITSRHYDFLPVELLDSLALLYMSLADKRGRLYKVEDQAIRRMEKPDEVAAFIRDVSIFKNEAIRAALLWRTAEPDMKHVLAVSLHARDVLVKMNRFASAHDLLKLTSSFKKQIRKWHS